MADSGVTIGCHSMSHPILTMPPKDVSGRAVTEFAAPPLYFASATPADLSRIEAENTEVAFKLDGSDSIDEASAQSHVTSFSGLELRHIKEGDLFVESIDLKRPSYYAVFVSAKDKSGRLCRGAWLFLYDKEKPFYLMK